MSPLLQMPSTCMVMHYRIHHRLAWLITISLLHFLPPSVAIPIDNGVVGVPQIECGPDSIAVEFVTQNPFMGRIYVKGYSNNANCIVTGDGLAQRGFNLGFNQCGIRRERQINPPGVGIAATVVISFHSIFITKVDRAYRINCFYMEAARTVSAELEISALTTQVISHQLPMPVCEYNINSLSGQPIKFARIGDPVLHSWTCRADQRDMFCMRVHTCMVDDGQGGQSVTILDSNGCAIDEHILQNLRYTSDLSAGQEAHVFKFADKPALYFNCQIELRLKDINLGCSQITPRCNEPLAYAAGRRKKRSLSAGAYSFDLPQKQISVLDIESIPEKETTPLETAPQLGGEYRNPFSHLDRAKDGGLDVKFDDSGADICVSKGTTIVLISLSLMLFISGATALLFTCFKRKLLQELIQFVSSGDKMRRQVY